MKRMTQLEVDARKALGIYNAPGANLPWLVENVVKGLADEQHVTEAYRETVRRRDATLKELFSLYEAMDLGDDPQGMGTLMVNNEAHTRLGMTFKRVLETL